VQSDVTTEIVIAKKSGFQMPVSQSEASRKIAFVTPSHDVETARPAQKPTKKTFQSSTSKAPVQKNGVTTTSSIKTNDRNNRVTSTKKAQRRVQKKDFPNAPKRPMNAYMYFTQAARKG
jgi:hypothetical protein